MASLEGWNFTIKLCPHRTVNSTVPSDEGLVKAIAPSQAQVTAAGANLQTRSPQGWRYGRQTQRNY